MKSVSEILILTKDLAEKERIASIINSLPTAYLNSLKELLRYAYFIEAKLDVPLDVKYTDSRMDDPSALIWASKGLHYFVPPISDTLSQKRKLNMFGERLDSLTSSDAEMYIDVLNKRFTLMTKKFAIKLFPELNK